MFTLLLGGYITYLDFENTFYVVAAAGAGILGISISASLRRNDFVSGVFTTFRGMKYSLNRPEKILGISALALMASPFLFMIAAAMYGKLAP